MRNDGDTGAEPDKFLNNFSLAGYLRLAVLFLFVIGTVSNIGHIWGGRKPIMD